VPERAGTVRCACTSAFAGVVLSGSMAPRAQVSTPPTLNRTVNLNYVYAAELGFARWTTRCTMSCDTGGR